MKLAIFPGHSGKDSGAINQVDLAKGDRLFSIESEITSGIASKMAAFCQLLGIDHRVCRGSFEDRIAYSIDCTAGIDIHTDSFPADTKIHGFHVIHNHGSLKGKALALSIDASLAVRHDRARQPHSTRDLFILRKTAFPCVLVECGFLTNTTDEASLMVEDTQWNIAWDLLQGFRMWAYR